MLKLSLLVASSLGGVLAIGSFTTANAFTAYVVPSNTAGNQEEFGGVLGMDFNVNSNITVTDLGVFDDLSNGISSGGTLTAELWTRVNNATGVLLGSQTFTNANPGTLDGGSRFKSISPLSLVPGSYTIVSYGYSSSNPNGNGRGGVPPWTTNSGGGAISFVGSSRYGGPLGASIGTTIDAGPANQYAAGTFKATVVPVPESQPLSILGAMTVLGLGIALKRRSLDNTKKNRGL